MKRLIMLLTLFHCLNVYAKKFQFFSSENEAEMHYATNVIADLKALNGSLEIKHLKPEIKRKLEQFVRLLTDAYKQQYNIELKYPHLLVFESRDIHISVASNEMDRKPFYIIASTAWVEETTDNEKLGIMAHELAHLYLQKSVGGVSFPPIKYYFESSGQKFGHQIVNNLKAQRDAKYIQGLSYFVGGYGDITLRGLPIGSDDEPFGFANYMKYLVNEDLEKESCKQAKRSYNFIGEILQESNNLNFTYLSFNDSRLPEEIKRFENYFVDCASRPSFSFMRLHRTVFEYEENEETLISIYRSYFEPETFRAIDMLISYFDHQTTYMGERIINTIVKARQEINNLNPELLLRVYTEEDHADEVAIKILLSLNISTEGLNSDLTKGFSCTGATDYGPVVDNHHNPCWRVQRNRSYEKYLRSKIKKY